LRGQEGDDWYGFKIHLFTDLRQENYRSPSNWTTGKSATQKQNQFAMKLKPDFDINRDID
jgi:hypothetical protein